MKRTQLILHREYDYLGKLLARRHNLGRPLLQIDSVSDKNCAMISLAYIYGAERYPEISRLSGRNGVSALLLRHMMKKLGSKNPHCRYLKGIGWSFKSIKNLCDMGFPVILTALHDGRGYYKNHSVIVTGYEVYESGKKFLIVYDNLNDEPCLIDYKKLSIISAIYWA